MPRHVAIIMDGNSRWAERQGWPASVGHEAGVRALKEVVKLSQKWGIEVLTVFAFSTENWLRPKTEVGFLMELFERVFQEQLNAMPDENIQVRCVGDLSMLPASLRKIIATLEEATQHNTGLKLSVAVSYSGRQDIVGACQRLMARVQNGEMSPEDLTEAAIDEELKTSWVGEGRNPDLLIRTSGEQRISNFMLWQTAYSEFLFVDSLWPDFGEAQLKDALLEYQKRNRRFGKHK
ncbi:unnamed protein product [Sphagnum jensenii]